MKVDICCGLVDRGKIQVPVPIPSSGKHAKESKYLSDIPTGVLVSQTVPEKRLVSKLRHVRVMPGMITDVTCYLFLFARYKFVFHSHKFL